MVAVVKTPLETFRSRQKQRGMLILLAGLTHVAC